MTGLTIDMVMSDAEALLAFIDADPAARQGPIGDARLLHERPVRDQRRGRPSRAGSRPPPRCTATCLVTDKANSPHLMAAATKARALLRLRRDRPLGADGDGRGS